MNRLILILVCGVASSSIVGGCAHHSQLVVSSDDHTPDITKLGRADPLRYTTALRKLLWADVCLLPPLTSANPRQGDGSSFPVAPFLYDDPIQNATLRESDAEEFARLWRALPFQIIHETPEFKPKYGLGLVGWHSDCICEIALSTDGRLAFITPCDALAKPFFVALDPRGTQAEQMITYIRRTLARHAKRA